MSDNQDDAETYQWGEPFDARRWHIFDGSRSLCRNWLYGGANQDVEPEQDEYREGKDCKECCRKAGVLES